MIKKAVVDAAFAVDRVLKPAEAMSADAAIASTALLLTMLKEHEARGVPAAIGLVAIRHASRAVSLMVEAREEHIRAHGAMNLDLKKLGMDELFIKPNDPPMMNGTVEISAEHEREPVPA